MPSVARSMARCFSRPNYFVAGVKRALRKGRLEIEVITMMYNEAFLAPLFVRHYAPWVDKITVFYSKSIDGTRKELTATAAQCGLKRLNIVPFEFPDGLNDSLKIRRLNQAVRGSPADFVICVDADEFVHPWPFETTQPREELAKETGEVVYCAMYESYRHATDQDIDRQQPPLFQRRHGVRYADLKLEAGKLLQNKHYTKPCIIRPDSGAQFEVGCHGLTTAKKGLTIWRGVHWGKADVFCTQRYVRDRRDHFSEENRRFNWGVQHFSTSEAKLVAELQAHQNDPELF